MAAELAKPSLPLPSGEGDSYQERFFAILFDSTKNRFTSG
jgi:hypothetical protein